MRECLVLKRDVHETLLRLLIGLLDRDGHICPFCHPKPDAPLFVSNHQGSAEPHAFSTGRHTRHTRQVPNLLFKIPWFTFLTPRRSAAATRARRSLPTRSRRIFW